MLYKLKYINERGESIEFKGNQYDFQEPTEFKNKTTNPFNLIRFEGFGEVGANVQLQKAPFQDGSTHIETQLEERHPYLEFVIVANDWNTLSMYRQTVSQVFNPKINGRFEVSYDNKTFILYSIPESVPYFGDEDKIGRTQIVSINLLCPDPYWRDPRVISRALRAYQGRFTLPTTFPVELGIEGDTTILTNEGDTPAPITIDIQGPVTNPQVINKTTGKFIRVNLSLSENEVLHIDTGRPRRVEIYRDGRTIENAMGYIDHYSDFWELSVGPNEVQYIADAGNANAIVAVAWQNRYVGI